MAQIARRAYVPLSTAFFDDATTLEAGEAAAFMYLHMMTKAKVLGNDGIFTEAQIARLGFADWKKRLHALESAGLVERVSGLITMPAWLKWNESSGEREARLEADRRRKEAWKAARLSEGNPL